MKLGFATAQLEKECREQREAVKKYGVAVAKRLRRRVKELESADSIEEVLQGPGKWHHLNYDRAGQVAGNVSGKLRIVVVPSADTPPVVQVIEIEDYHRKER